MWIGVVWCGVRACRWLHPVCTLGRSRWTFWGYRGRQSAAFRPSSSTPAPGSAWCSARCCLALSGCLWCVRRHTSRTVSYRTVGWLGYDGLGWVACCTQPAGHSRPQQAERETCVDCAVRALCRSCAVPFVRCAVHVLCRSQLLIFIVFPLCCRCSHRNRCRWALREWGSDHLPLLLSLRCTSRTGNPVRAGP